MLGATGIALFAVDGTLLALSLLAVALRVYVRTRLVPIWGADDVLMVIAMIIQLVDTGFTFHGVALGSGKTFQEFVPISTVVLRSIFFGEIFYILVVMFAKLSIGAFLLRVLRAKWQRYTIYGVIIFNTVLSLAYFFVVVFQCMPVSSYWHLADQLTGKGKCMEKSILTTASYGFSISTASTDLIFSTLPIAAVGTALAITRLTILKCVRQLWSLQMNGAMKLSIAGLLGTGMLATVVTFVRIPFITQLNDANPTTFIDSAISLILLTAIEAGLFILVGNVASLRPLFIKALGSKDEIRQVQASRRKMLGKVPRKWQITRFGTSFDNSFADGTLKEFCVEGTESTADFGLKKMASWSDDEESEVRSASLVKIERPAVKVVPFIAGGTNWV